MGFSTEHLSKECSAAKGRIISFDRCYSVTVILAAQRGSPPSRCILNVLLIEKPQVNTTYLFLKIDKGVTFKIISMAHIQVSQRKAGSRLCEMLKVAGHLCLPLQKQIHLKTHTELCIPKSYSHIGKEGLQHILPPSFLSSPWINMPSVQMKQLSTKVTALPVANPCVCPILRNMSMAKGQPALLCSINAFIKHTPNHYQLSKSAHTF